MSSLTKITTITLLSLFILLILSTSPINAEKTDNFFDFPTTHSIVDSKELAFSQRITVSTTVLDPDTKKPISVFDFFTPDPDATRVESPYNGEITIRFANSNPPAKIDGFIYVTVPALNSETCNVKKNCSEMDLYPGFAFKFTVNEKDYTYGHDKYDNIKYTILTIKNVNLRDAFQIWSKKFNPNPTDQNVPTEFYIDITSPNFTFSSYLTPPLLTWFETTFTVNRFDTTPAADTQDKWRVIATSTLESTNGFSSRILLPSTTYSGFQMTQPIPRSVVDIKDLTPVPITAPFDALFSSYYMNQTRVEEDYTLPIDRSLIDQFGVQFESLTSLYQYNLSSTDIDCTVSDYVYFPASRSTADSIVVNVTYKSTQQQFLMTRTGSDNNWPAGFRLTCPISPVSWVTPTFWYVIDLSTSPTAQPIITGNTNGPTNWSKFIPHITPGQVQTTTSPYSSQPNIRKLDQAFSGAALGTPEPLLVAQVGEFGNDQVQNDDEIQSSSGVYEHPRWVTIKMDDTKNYDYFFSQYAYVNPYPDSTNASYIILPLILVFGPIIVGGFVFLISRCCMASNNKRENQRFVSAVEISSSGRP